MKKDNNNPKEKAKENLEAKFQQLGKDIKVPKDLKKEVFSTLDTLTLFADIADLFTGKFAMTEIEALGIPEEEEEEETLKTVDNKKLNGNLKSINGKQSTDKKTDKL